MGEEDERICRGGGLCRISRAEWPVERQFTRGHRGQNPPPAREPREAEIDFARCACYRRATQLRPLPKAVGNCGRGIAIWRRSHAVPERGAVQPVDADDTDGGSPAGPTGDAGDDASSNRGRLRRYSGAPRDPPEPPRTPHHALARTIPPHAFTANV